MARRLAKLLLSLQPAPIHMVCAFLGGCWLNALQPFGWAAPEAMLAATDAVSPRPE